jgi:hypothetical protein
MLEKITNLPAGIEGVTASGKVTREDYEKVIEPIFEDARRKGEKVRFFYEFGSEFQGFSAAAAWEDARFGLGAIRQLAGCAVVSDSARIRDMTKFVALLLPSPVRVFAHKERPQAIEWLKSLPEQPAISHRLIAETGVIVVEVKQALRAQDFDALAATADQWIQERGTLNGLVLHAHHFPGWENLEGLIKHIRFVRDHHTKIKRIAVVSDARLASLAPRVGEHFVAAEIQTFHYDKLDDAIAWARGAGK